MKCARRICEEFLPQLRRGLRYSLPHANATSSSSGTQQTFHLCFIIHELLAHLKEHGALVGERQKHEKAHPHTFQKRRTITETIARCPVQRMSYFRCVRQAKTTAAASNTQKRKCCPLRMPIIAPSIGCPRRYKLPDIYLSVWFLEDSQYPCKHNTYLLYSIANKYKF